jgi:diguanylate cyclase (GGDEF)-like protein/PAS domain S-box-containing protein
MIIASMGKKMKNYRFADLFDISLIQKLADSNFQAVGLPMSIVDACDSSVAVMAGRSDICRKFRRNNISSDQQCPESAFVTGHLDKGSDMLYKCKNGLWHAAIPIIVCGQHIATMFFSQFFLENEIPDRDFFLQQSAACGYDQMSHTDALGRIPVISVERFNYILSFSKALAGLISDLAEQSVAVHNTKRSLAESEGKYRTLVENIGIGIYRDALDENSGFNKCNPALAEIFGFISAEECMKVPTVSLYFDPADRKALINDVRMDGFVRSREILMRKKDGAPIWCSVTASASYDEDCDIRWIDGVVEDITDSVIAKDKLETERNDLEMRVRERTSDLALANELLLAEIGERKKAEAMLRELSEKDYLTMIYNRRKFFELLSYEIEKARRYRRPLSLIIFDIDHFKAINDRYGHIAGDSVLKAVAAIVECVIRKNDLLARYGGEEFVILSPETDIHGASAVAEKIRSSIEEYSFECGGKITLSAGVAEWSAGDSEMNLIEKADRALYVAKNSGRNRVESNNSHPSRRVKRPA